MSLKSFMALLFMVSSMLPLAAQSVGQRLQQAYFDTATLTLDNFTATAVPAPAAAEPPPLPPIPVTSLHPWPAPSPAHIHLNAWLATALTTLLALLAVFADRFVAFQRYRNSPAAQRRRHARHQLQRFLDDDLPLPDALDALRQRFNLPPGTSLSLLADTIAPTHPRLADACRSLETTRFAPAADNSAVLLNAFRTALRTALLITLLTVLPACTALVRTPAAFSDWAHAVLLASQGHTAESLDLFLTLREHTPDSPELSLNIATLLDVLPTAAAPADALHDSAAWKHHAALLRQSRERFPRLPELLLPALPLLFALTALFLCHRRRHAALLTAALSAAVVLALAVTIAPRQDLRNRAITSSHACLKLLPAPDAPAAETLTAPAAVTLIPKSPAVNGYLRVRTATAIGWLPQSSLLSFH